MKHQQPKNNNTTQHDNNNNETTQAPEEGTDRGASQGHRWRTTADVPSLAPTPFFNSNEGPENTLRR